MKRIIKKVINRRRKRAELLGTNEIMANVLGERKLLLKPTIYPQNYLAEGRETPYDQLLKDQLLKEQKNEN